MGMFWQTTWMNTIGLVPGKGQTSVSWFNKHFHLLWGGKGRSSIMPEQLNGMFRSRSLDFSLHRFLDPQGNSCPSSENRTRCKILVSVPRQCVFSRFWNWRLKSKYQGCFPTDNLRDSRDFQALHCSSAYTVLPLSQSSLPRKTEWGELPE